MYFIALFSLFDFIPPVLRNLLTFVSPATRRTVLILNNICMEVLKDQISKKRRNAWRDWKTTISGGSHAFGCMVYFSGTGMMLGVPKRFLWCSWLTETKLCFSGMVYPYLSSHIPVLHIEGMFLRCKGCMDIFCKPNKKEYLQNRLFGSMVFFYPKIVASSVRICDVVVTDCLMDISIDGLTASTSLFFI